MTNAFQTTGNSPTPSTPITVLKFGSSVLRNEGEIPLAVSEVYRVLREGHRVVVVVSAFGKTTDSLYQRANALVDGADPATLAAWVATGEQTAASLVALHLDRAGIPTSLLTPSQIGLRTRGPVQDSEAVDVNAAEIHAALSKKPVAVIPGFIGVNDDGVLTLLGRGGSDLTAIFLAERLDARCRLVKDVDGIYEFDPARSVPAPRRFSQITWDDALKIGGRIVQAKSTHYAKARNLAFEITAPGSACASVVGPGPSALVAPEPHHDALRVGLLGLGTVGLGLYQRLNVEPERFTITGIGVRYPKRYRDLPIDHALVTSNIDSVIAGDAQVIVELIGGLDAEPLIERALRAGKHVVTANKAVIAASGPRLETIARDHNVTLRYSAAIGGAVPALEAVKRTAAAGVIVEIEGVLNGTCNFVLDRIGQGVSYKDAVTEAQDRGFAEADPTADVAGIDAASKIAILASHAFGITVDPATIDRRGIDTLPEADVRAAIARGEVIRLVARARATSDGVTVTVAPIALPLTHPLAGSVGEGNALVVSRADGHKTVVTGRGAGRWPTVESVFGDLVDTEFALVPESVETSQR
jgi:homoserine dehydrogenase